MNTIVLLVLIALGTASEDDLVLPDELASCALSAQQELLVYGRLESWVGDCLTLQGSTTCFVVDSNRRYPVLRSADYRSISLVLRVTHATSQPEVRYAVIDVARGPEQADWFSGRLDSLNRMPFDRRFGVIETALSWSVRDADLGLQASGAEQLRRQIVTVSEAREYVVSARLLETIIELSRQHLVIDSDPALESALGAIHERAASDPNSSAVLRSKGYVRDRGKWRLESAVLQEIGMIRVGDRYLTLDAFRLEREATGWSRSGRNTSLLRSLTPQQYGTYAKAGETREGMSRTEVMTAWGYAERVTWQRRESQWFEGWFYGDQWICFVDGLAFNWSSR